MKILTEQEAWQDFYAYIRQSPTWGQLSQKEKNRLSMANTDSRGVRIGRDGKPLRLGFARLRSLMEHYAPGRYSFEVIERVYLHD